jgi:hypothetical protein
VRQAFQVSPSRTVDGPVDFATEEPRGLVIYKIKTIITLFAIQLTIQLAQPLLPPPLISRQLTMLI